MEPTIFNALICRALIRDGQVAGSSRRVVELRLREQYST